MTRDHWLVRRFLSVCVLLSVAACSDVEQTTKQPAPSPVPLEEVTVPLLFTSETQEFAQRAVEAFNRVNNSVGDRAIVTLKPQSATAAEVSDLLHNQPTQPFLWLARSTFEVEGADLKSESNDFSGTQCLSLFSTAPTFVFRSVDSFAFGSKDEPPDLTLFLQESPNPSHPEGSLVIGHPALSVSGSSTLAILASAAGNIPFGELTMESLTANFGVFKRMGTRISHQFAADETMLAWLASREGGLPVLALTTRQQLRSFSKRAPQTQLKEIAIARPPFDLDYPLCVFEPSQSSALQLLAVRLARGFLMSPHVAEVAQAAGFSDKQPPLPSNVQISRESLAELVRKRQAFEGESWASLVMDTSITVERNLLDSVRKEIADRILATDTLPFATSITSCSTTPEVIVRPTRKAILVAEGLEKLRISGGFAFRDCLMEAVESASGNEIQAARKTIILITKGRETSSVTALNQLKQFIPQRLTRTRTILYVLSIGNGQTDNEEFNSRARSLGALVVPTTPSRVSQDLASLLAELS
jgi:hypothetical protein